MVSISRALLTAVLAGVVVVVPLAVAGQAAPMGLTTGTRVRVTTVANQQFVGTVLSSLGDTLLLSSPDGIGRIAVPYQTLRILEISEGSSRKPGAAVGVAIGVLIGGFSGAQRGKAADSPGGYGEVLGTLAGLFGGVLVGGAVGAAFSIESWRFAPLVTLAGPSVPTPTTVDVVSASTVRTIAPGPGPSSYQMVFATGQHLRITSQERPAQRLAGKVSGMSADSLTLRLDGKRVTQAFAINRLQSLEVRGGRNRKRGLVIGALIGSLFGTVTHYSEAAPRTNTAGDEIAGNALIGGILGLVFSPKGWKHLPLPGR